LQNNRLPVDLSVYRLSFLQKGDLRSMLFADDVKKLLKVKNGR